MGHRAEMGGAAPRLNEAARIVAEGVATAEDVDTATRVGLGLRFAMLGLVEYETLTRLVGLLQHLMPKPE